MHMLYHTRQFV